jgi:hypothetical protein
MKVRRVLRDSSYSQQGANAEFWFNLKTLKVEVGPQAAAAYRVGPFASEVDAKNALQLLRERSKSWRQEDEEDQK